MHDSTGVRGAIYAAASGLAVVAIIQMGTALYWIGSTSQALQEINRRLDDIQIRSVRDSQAHEQRFINDIIKLEARMDKIEERTWPR